MINKENYMDALLEEYQKEFMNIWPQLKDRPALHTWARVVQHATTACEGMRRRKWSIVLEEIATTIVWWLAFIQKLNLLDGNSRDKTYDVGSYDDDFVFGLSWSATEVIWRKYPSVCPVEFGLAGQEPSDVIWDRRPATVCMCLARKKEVENRTKEEKAYAKKLLREFAKKNSSYCPQGIGKLEDMFRTIFAGSIYQSSLEDLFFHFIEEIGEVSEALANATTSKCLRMSQNNKMEFIEERKQKLYGIAEELADVFSWAVAIVAKVQALLVSFEEHLEGRIRTDSPQNLASQHISLGGIIWQKYGFENNHLLCDDCNKRPCGCTQERAQPLYKQALSTENDRLRKLIEYSRELTLD